MSRSWRTRAESEADIATIREITVAAFSPPKGVEILDALRSDPAWIEGLSVVSTDASDIVVGYALLRRCHIDETPAVMRGPVAVRPDRRRAGATRPASSQTAVRESGLPCPKQLGGLEPGFRGRLTLRNPTAMLTMAEAPLLGREVGPHGTLESCAQRATGD